MNMKLAISQAAAVVWAVEAFKYHLLIDGHVTRSRDQVEPMKTGRE